MNLRLNLGLRAALAIPLVIMLVVGLGALGVYNYLSKASLIETEEEASLKGNLRLAQTILGDHIDRYLQMAMLVSGMPTVAENFAKGDRNRLIAEFWPVYESLNKRFKVELINFHKPPAVAFLRAQVYDKEVVGEDLSAFRLALVEANQKKVSVKGIETGGYGIGLRGIVPISFKGEHVGTVELGGSLSPAVEELRKTINVDAGVVIAKEVLSAWPGVKDLKVIGDYVSLHTTNPAMTEGLLKAELLAQAKKAPGKIFLELSEHGGKQYGVALSPLKDYAGKEIGYVYIFKDRTPLLVKARWTGLVNLALYLLAILAASLLILVSLRKAVVDPVVKLTRSADAVSQGMLGEKIELKTGDEIATLAKSIDRMRVSMKKLLE